MLARERLSLLHTEGGGETPSQRNRENAHPIHVEEANSVSTQQRDCHSLLYAEEALLSRERRHTLLYTNERGALLYMHRRQTPSPTQKGKSERDFRICELRFLVLTRSLSTLVSRVVYTVAPFLVSIR